MTGVQTCALPIYELESNIEPFKGLLLGIFFISVGAGIDFRLIASQPILIALMTLGAVGVKLGALLALGRVFSQPRAARNLVAFALAQVGEFAFVLFSVAEQGRILPPDKVGPLVAVTALSMGLTPLVLLLHDRLAARCNLVKPDSREADEIEPVHRRIVRATLLRRHRAGDVGGGLRALHAHAHVGQRGDEAFVEGQPAGHGAVAASLINSGQDCTAATRAYVQRPLYDAFVAGVADLFASVRLGPPEDPATDLGPLISALQAERVAAFVDRARGYGAHVVTGGSAPGGDLARGAYYRPTLVTGAAQDSEIVQDEIFGPVLVVLPFDTDDEGIALANDTRYGLQAGVFTADITKGLRAARTLDFGGVVINEVPTFRADQQPYGGLRDSGNTRLASTAETGAS